MNEKNKMYIDKCKSYINFMITHNQWTGIHKEDIDRWIDNFIGLSDEFILLAYTLLINIIYFSEKDILNALREGVNNLLFKNVILKQQMDSNFTLSSKAIFNILKEELDASCFIPLLDRNAPHESANYMVRLLVQNNIIQPDQSKFLWDLKMENFEYKRIVIIDDCVGSGDQLSDFWNKNAKIIVNGTETLLKIFCMSNHNIEIYYLTLFGYSNNIIKLKEEIPEINIICVNLLEDTQRVFSNESYIWQGNDLIVAKEMLDNLLTEKGVHLLGYKNLDFALIMDGTIPDWSLPMLYKHTSDWYPLLRRKSSI